jgi:hypothetical protein
MVEPLLHRSLMLETVLKPLAGCKAPFFGVIRRLFFGRICPDINQKMSLGYPQNLSLSTRQEF